MPPRATLPLLFALAAVACVHEKPRPVIGRAHLRVVEPMTVTQPYYDLAITIEDGGVSAGANIHFVHYQGCLRGDYLLRTLYVCPRSDEPARWTGTLLPKGSPSGSTLNFTAAVEEARRSILHVVMGNQQATVRLGLGESMEEVRASPELIGVLFALGLPPLAKDGLFDLTEDEPDAAGPAGGN